MLATQCEPVHLVALSNMAMPHLLQVIDAGSGFTSQYLTSSNMQTACRHNKGVLPILPIAGMQLTLGGFKATLPMNDQHKARYEEVIKAKSGQQVCNYSSVGCMAHDMTLMEPQLLV